MDQIIDQQKHHKHRLVVTRIKRESIWGWDRWKGIPQDTTDQTPSLMRERKRSWEGRKGEKLTRGGQGPRGGKKLVENVIKGLSPRKRPDGGEETSRNRGKTDKGRGEEEEGRVKTEF